MNDQAIEQEIQAKGKTAPRVTPADIEANIASEHFFTAGQGSIGEYLVRVGARSEPNPALNLLTFCVLVLRNGFTVTGESACASPENFDAEIGRKIARQNAAQKIWPLMGYALKLQMAERAKFDAEPAAGERQQINQRPALGTAHLGYGTLPSHQQRVIDEKCALDERKQKLEAFLETATFAQLENDEQGRLHAQLDAMTSYARILGERIAGFVPTHHPV